jgi:hypothetical protein
MSMPLSDKEAIKQLFKEALVELLEEERELVYGVFAEVLEDLALAEAVREGQRSGLATRDEVVDILERHL